MTTSNLVTYRLNRRKKVTEEILDALYLNDLFLRCQSLAGPGAKWEARKKVCVCVGGYISPGNVGIQNSQSGTSL